MERRRPQAPVICFLIFVLVMSLLYLPLLYLMAGSLIENTSSGIQFTLRWYREVLEDLILREALNRSLLIGIGNALLSTLMGSLASVALLRSNFAFKKTLEIMSLISLVMPELVFALSLLSWFVILKMELNLFTVIIAHVSFTLSFVILLISSRLSSMDLFLEEAARDLGASERQIFLHVTMPLLKPAIGMSFILSFLLSFDDFLVTFFTSGAGSDTLPMVLYGAMRLGPSPKLNALSTIMILFSIALIAILFRSHSIRDFWQKRRP